MARAHISLPEEKLERIDAWADEHGFNRSEAIGVMADIVAGDLEPTFQHPGASNGQSGSDGRRIEVEDVPATLPVEEARDLWAAAKQGSDTRLDVLAAAIRGEGKLFDAEELHDLAREVTVPATPGYEENYVDQLLARGDLTVSPLFSRAWVSDTDVERKLTQLREQIGDPYTGLDVTDRAALRRHLGIDDGAETYAASEYEVALWASAWQEILAATGGSADDWLGKWAIEEFVSSVNVRVERDEGFERVREAIRDDIGR